MVCGYVQDWTKRDEALPIKKCRFMLAFLPGAWRQNLPDDNSATETSKQAMNDAAKARGLHVYV